MSSGWEKFFDLHVKDEKFCQSILLNIFLKVIINIKILFVTRVNAKLRLEEDVTYKVYKLSKSVRMCMYLSNDTENTSLFPEWGMVLEEHPHNYIIK